ncbi:MAG: hypothetical protein Hyperionvirus15_17 [Hyperionvirus sp.]|uniref:Uncharacterized protein n=1 Tax=Hyperionvirus sp. TaxID=2487770 RepID=A0A3G5AF33_9VIRU|nr:MAG: hypothetical protein Hyperionvirus15_17 [Hyperionvirus sp.]
MYAAASGSKKMGAANQMEIIKILMLSFLEHCMIAYY